ncbi:efflux RND transporter periplasmic adaptor subunit [Desulfohalovibrio reitneri]|uniref:efflux RND transporter periplasmic adaptor subunit n=1 Tax=Desulfohalovibrio reitneri TaxID=1307759 RepID=UPI0009DD86A4|nr:efflux RND transporter periplasmic adaptor subunit [Desulfohalovibrio reitneri]
MDPNLKETGGAANGKRRFLASLIQRAVVIMVLLGVVAGGIMYMRQADPKPEAVQSRGAGGPVPVKAVTLTPRDVPLQPVYLGQAEASQTVQIRARVRGFLQSKHFEEGSRVEKGQLLFRIDPRSFQAELELARSRLASAQAQFERATQKVRRYSRLVSSNAATQDELEEWQTEKSVARATIRMEKARITQAELDLGYTTVESPITGLIGMAQKDVGSYVGDASNGLLAVVEKVDPIYVRYTVSEQDILRARRLAEKGKVSRPSLENMRLRVTLADGSQYPHEGRISYADPEIDPETGTAVMRGTIPNPDGDLMPGQFVHVRQVGVKRLDALLAPKKAVIQNPTGAMVYVADGDGKAQIRPVKLGEWHEDGWIVESGLKPGERVIVNKLMQLKPGADVDVAEVAPGNLAEGEAVRTAGEM